MRNALRLVIMMCIMILARQSFAGQNFDRCESLFNTENLKSFVEIQNEMKNKTSEDLVKMRPDTKEARLAWLLTISARASQNALGSNEFKMPKDFFDKMSLDKILSKDIDDLNYVDAVRLSSHLEPQQSYYMRLAKLLLKLDFTQVDRTLISMRLRTDIRRNALMDVLMNEGIIDSESQKIKFQKKWVEMASTLKFIFQGVGAVFGVQSVVHSGTFNGALIPVVRLVRQENLPPELMEKVLRDGIEQSLPDLQKFYGWRGHVEAGNWFISRTLQKVTIYILLAIALDDFLKSLGINPKDYWSELITNRKILEQAVYDAQLKDATELGLKIDKASAVQNIHNMSIEDLEDSLKATARNAK